MAYYFEGSSPDFFAAKNGTDNASIFGILYLSIICSGIAYWVWFWALDRLSLITVTMLALLSPVVAYIIDVFYQDFNFSLTEGFGICLVLAGLIYQSIIEGQKPTEPNPAQSSHSIPPSS